MSTHEIPLAGRVLQATCVERDEWRRRADAAEAERDALKADEARDALEGYQELVACEGRVLDAEVALAEYKRKARATIKQLRRDLEDARELSDRFEQERDAACAERDEARCDALDWVTIADGVAHDPRCEDGRPCLRCQAWEGKKPAPVDIDAILNAEAAR